MSPFRLERWEGPARYDLTVVVNDKLHAHAATVLIDTLKEAKFHHVEGEANLALKKEDVELIVRPKPSSR